MTYHIPWDTILYFASVVLVPAVLLGTAIYAWRRHRKLTALQTTVNFIVHTEIGNRFWRERADLFQKVAIAGELMGLADTSKLNAAEMDQAHKVNAFLSHHELVAVAIRNKAIDEKTYKDWTGVVYLLIWEQAASYIFAVRKINQVPGAFVHFENLAKKWKKQGS